MPHTRSAKKQARKNVARNLRNRAVKQELKTLIKKVSATAAGGNIEQLRQDFTVAVRKLDKAAAKRVVHPNLAARKKSQLARLLNQKTSGSKPPS